MKPLAFNLKDAKKVSGDKSSSTFVLKDGHQLRVAHAPLPALQRKQLEKLPIHMDVGGTAGGAIPIANPEPLDYDTSVGNSPAPKEAGPSSIYGNLVGQGVDLVKRLASAQTPGIHSDDSQSDSPQPSSNRVASSDNTGVTSAGSGAVALNDLPDAGQPVTGQASSAQSSNATAATGTGIPSSPQKDLPGLVQQGQDAIQEQKKYEEDLAKANAGIETSDLEARQNLMEGSKRNFDDFKAHHEATLKAYMDNQIKPNNYVDSMSSTQRVKTAIGLFLGGWGSAYTHQGNPALDYLNKQIDRDIEGQRSRLDQQKTLLGANQELYHDGVLADNATRIDLNNITSHQLQLAADKLGTTAAKAKADAASAQYGIANDALLKQNAIRATVLHSITSNGGQGLSALDLGTAGIIPQEEAGKEQKSIDSQKTALSVAENVMAKLDQEQKFGNLASFNSRTRVKQLKAQLVSAILNSSEVKKPSPEFINQEVEPFVTGVLENPKTRQAGLDGIKNIIGNHADPTPYVTAKAPGLLPRYPFQIEAQQRNQLSATPQVAPGGPPLKIGDVRYLPDGRQVQIINQKQYKVLGGAPQPQTAIASAK